MGSRRTRMRRSRAFAWIAQPSMHGGSDLSRGKASTRLPGCVGRTTYTAWLPCAQRHGQPARWHPRERAAGEGPACRRGGLLCTAGAVLAATPAQHKQRRCRSSCLPEGGTHLSQVRHGTLAVDQRSTDVQPVGV